MRRQYRFGGQLVLNHFVLRRVEEEKEREDAMDYVHHINPFRELGDAINVSAEVDTPWMEGLEEQAFLDAFNDALGETLDRVRHFYQRRLDKLKEEKERTET